MLRFDKPGAVQTIDVMTPPDREHYDKDSVYDAAQREYTELQRLQCDAKKYGKAVRVELAKLWKADKVDDACTLALKSGLSAVHVIYGGEELASMPIAAQIEAIEDIGIAQYVAMAIMRHNKATPRQGES